MSVEVRKHWFLYSILDGPRVTLSFVIGTLVLGPQRTRHFPRSGRTTQSNLASKKYRSSMDWLKSVNVTEKNNSFDMTH